MPPKQPQPKRVPIPEPETESDEDEMIGDEEPRKDPIEVIQELALPQRRCLYALKANHQAIRDVRTAYDSELKALELKYDEICGKLYEERRKIVNGERDVTEEEVKAGEAASQSTSKVEVDAEEEEEENRPRRGVGAKKAEEKKAEEVSKEEDADKGIPKFWLTALSNHEVVMDSITDKDVEALTALLDITCQHIDNDPFKGYVLSFHFGPNKFFKDTVLTKKYFLERECDESILTKTEGCPINWTSKENNLTVEIKKKTQKHKTKKTVRVVEQEVKCESFFNFFSPPRIPQEDDDEEMEEDIDFEELEEEIEFDYEVGNSIKDRVITHAIDYYTGAALAYSDIGAQLGGMIPMEAGGAVAPAAHGGKGPAGQQDCKQQ